MYIRTRLTLLFLLLLVLVLAALSVTVYQLTRSNLLGGIDQDVRHQAAIIRAATRPCMSQTRLCAPALDVFNSPDVFLQVQDPRGDVLASSGNLGKHILPLMRDAIAADQVKEVPVGNMPLFVYSQPVIVDHQLLGYVIVAQSPQTIYLALHQLENFLLLGVIVTSALALLVVWLVVRRAMQPLEQLASSA